MSRPVFSSLFLLAVVLLQPNRCVAEYYGSDAARSLVARLSKGRAFPVGHPRVYDLPGYESYRPRLLPRATPTPKRLGRSTSGRVRTSAV
jgi:hypothetical protein